MHGYPGGHGHTLPRKAPAGTDPRPGRAHDLHDLGQFQAAGELQSTHSPCFSELCVHKAKGARGDDAGNLLSEINEKLVLMVIKNQRH